MSFKGRDFQASGDEDPINLRPGHAPGRKTHKKSKAPICFNRTELYQILQIYGLRVAKGEWRDYAINTYKDKAVFSIFRKTSEVPLYRIEKDPGLVKKQGAYRIITPTGLILKRGHDLGIVLRVLIPKPQLVMV